MSAERTEPAAASPASRYFVSQRTRLHYLDWGNSSAPPVVLLHGGRDHAHSWDHVAAALCDRFHVLVPDLRGHGDSGWSAEGNYSVAALVFDLAEFVRHLNVAKVSLVAHSLGGKTALRYASLYPDEVGRLVAIEGTGLPYGRNLPPAERWRHWIAAKRRESDFRPVRYASFGEALARMQQANPRLSDERARHLTLHGSVRNDDGSYSWKYDPAVRLFLPLDLSREEDLAQWQAIRCPILLVWGTESWAADPAADGSAAQFADARVLRAPGAGHWPQHDCADLVIEALRSFLSGA